MGYLEQRTGKGVLEGKNLGGGDAVDNKPSPVMPRLCQPGCRGIRATQSQQQVIPVQQLHLDRPAQSEPMLQADLSLDTQSKPH